MESRPAVGAVMLDDACLRAHEWPLKTSVMRGDLLLKDLCIDLILLI